MPYSYGQRAASRAWYRLIMALLQPVGPLLKLLAHVLLFVIIASVVSAVLGPFGWLIAGVVVILIWHRRHVHTVVHRVTRATGGERFGRARPHQRSASSSLDPADELLELEAAAR